MNLDTKTLKVGDEVVLIPSCRYSSDRVPSIGVVVSIGPSGRVKIKNEYSRIQEFNSDGSARRTNFGDRIEAVTEEYRATIQEATDRRKLEDALSNPQTWLIAKVRRVLRALEEES